MSRQPWQFRCFFYFLPNPARRYIEQHHFFKGTIASTAATSSTLLRLTGKRSNAQDSDSESESNFTIHITWLRVYVTTVKFFFATSRSHASELLPQPLRFLIVKKVLIRMSTFLRRFATSASAGKNMYFILAVASALPVYTILNDNTSSSASVPSRSNVFVSGPQKKKSCCLMEPPLFFINSSVQCCHRLQGFRSYCFPTFWWQGSKNDKKFPWTRYWSAWLWVWGEHLP